MPHIFRKQKLAIFLFLAPLIILYMVIMIIPIVQTFYYSFTTWNGVTDAVYTGVDNYNKLFDSRDLPIALTNSIIYSVVLTVYQIGLATLIAFFLATCKVKYARIFKDAYFFPVLLSVSVVAQLWVFIYHGDYGLINGIADVIGSSWSQNWLNQKYINVVAIVIAEAWKGMGYHMLIIYAAMRNIPGVYYEAATIDGASKGAQFFRIMLPLAAPSIFMSVIMCITYGFRAFEMIFLMTGGGPGNYSTTLPIMMYSALFTLRNYGYGSAIATVIVVISVTLMIVLNKVAKRFEVEY